MSRQNSLPGRLYGAREWDNYGGMGRPVDHGKRSRKRREVDDVQKEIDEATNDEPVFADEVERDAALAQIDIDWRPTFDRLAET